MMQCNQLVSNWCQASVVRYSELRNNTWILSHKVPNALFVVNKVTISRPPAYYRGRLFVPLSLQQYSSAVYAFGIIASINRDPCFCLEMDFQHGVPRKSICDGNFVHSSSILTYTTLCSSLVRLNSVTFLSHYND